jgi:hypothetical protein
MHKGRCEFCVVTERLTQVTEEAAEVVVSFTVTRVCHLVADVTDGSCCAGGVTQVSAVAAAEW